MKNVTQFIIKNGLTADPENGRHYTFVTELENEYVVKVECFKITHFEETLYSDNPMGTTVEGPFYERRGASSSIDTTSKLDEAKRDFEGSIKWDGCSNLTFYPDEQGYSHFCGRKGATDIGLLIDNAYSLAKKLMGGNVDEGCFEDL